MIIKKYWEYFVYKCLDINSYDGFENYLLTNKIIFSNNKKLIFHFIINKLE